MRAVSDSHGIPRVTATGGEPLAGAASARTLRLSIVHAALALLLSLSLVAPAAAQPLMHSADPPRVERISGLSHNTILSILQDSQGFLWIGTPDGLNRYDAYDFVVYRHIPGEESSLSHNTIKALLEDREGHLWIGTDRGLDRFDRRADRFVHIPLGLDSLLSSQRTVLDLLEDATGSIWIATNAAGLFRMDPRSGRIRSFRNDQRKGDGDAFGGSLADNTVWSLHEDGDGGIWAATTKALHVYDAVDDRMRPVAVFDDPPPFRILHEEGSRIWFSNDLSVWALDRTTGLVSSIPGIPRDLGVNVMEESDEGVRWMGTQRGLFRVDPRTSRPDRIEIDPAPTAYLPNNVRALHEDRTGALWVGTLGGLYRIDPYAKPFKHLSGDPEQPGSLGDNTVMAIHQDTEGRLWLGTLGGGLYSVDRRNGTIHQYRRRADGAHSLCSDLIWTLAEDAHDTMWIGADDGLCVFDRRTGGFTRFMLPVEHGTGQPAVNDILLDRRGRLWFATYLGVYQLDPKVGRVSRIGFDTDTSNAVFGSVQALYEDRRGQIWISFYSGVVFRVDPETGRSSRVPLYVEEGEEPVGEGIWSIHEDGEGRLWFGGDEGLIRFDPADRSVYHYSTRDGLPGSIVYAIAEDARQRLWLSTNHGIVRLDARNDGRIRVYDAGDGLQNTEFNRRAVFESVSGELFFGGTEGVTSFFPDRIRDNPHVPPVALTHIRTEGRDTVLAVNPFGLERMVLTHRDTRVVFEFSALSFSNASRNRFAYRLQGFDRGWVDVGTRRSAQYTNIPAGDYVFQVKGSNDDGLWNEVGASLVVRVLPPFWQTWWFRLLVLGAVAGLLAALYRYRVRHLIEMERMRLRIAGDLHDDIGSNLSSIALLSDMVQGRGRLDERERDQLSKISRSARSMVSVLRDIVWSIDPDADSPEELVRRMEETAASMLAGRRWTLRRPSGEPAWELDMDTRRHVFLIFKEALHNIIRHAHAEEVTISLEEEDGVLCLRVEDDGAGFEPATVRRGHGLSNLRKRTAEIGGEMTVRSQPGRGTSIELRMPTHRRLFVLRRRKRRKRAVQGTP